MISSLEFFPLLKSFHINISIYDSLLILTIKILHIGNFFTKKNEFECNYCKAAFVSLNFSFWKIYLVCVTHRGGFGFLLILDIWGISFHAVVVFGLGKNFLFKSALGHWCTYMVGLNKRTTT